jgi:diguanylate cyclase (GGDEF)-like protein
MSGTPSTSPPYDPAHEPAAVLRDEVAEHRVRRASGGHLPQQRDVDAAGLSEPDREDYELRLDAYEVQLAAYRERLEEFAAQLEAAHHDGLTGTWLRHAGRQLLEEEVQRAARLDTPLSIAFVDVDGLKARNDRLGHAAGDHALVTIARALIVGLRGYDHVVRWGGDEFLCVLPGLTEPEASRRLQQVRGFLAAGVHGLTISVGIAERHSGETIDALVGRADRALYVSRGRR